MTDSFSLHERSVLLIGSNQSEVDLWKKTILSQSPFYGVTTAYSREEAQDLIAEREFDLVVIDLVVFDSTSTDYQSQHVAGDNLIAQIHKAKPLIPIIVLTNNDSPELALNVLKQGASDFLPKIGSYEKFLPRTLTTNLQRAMLLENLRESYLRLERSSRDEALLNRMIMSIHSSLSLEEIIDGATQSLSQEFHVTRAVICLTTSPGSPFRIVRQVTKPTNQAISEKSLIFARYHDLLLDVGERRPLVMMQDDTYPFARELSPELQIYSIKSMIMLPLVYRGQLMGLMHLDDCDHQRLWNQSEINLLNRIANQLSIAVSQAKLYQIVETQSQSIDKLTDLCSQLNTVVNSTRELTERQESREKVRVKLSAREIEVLRKVAMGLSNKEIADSCHITEGTTEVHVSRLRKKLNLTSRAHLVRYAYENHLV